MYATGSAGVLIAPSLSAALAKAALARALRRLLPVVNRLAGPLLAASGAYLVLYWLPALRGDAVPDSPLIRRTQLSSGLSGFFSQRTTLFAIALATPAATGIGAVVLETRRRTARDRLADPDEAAGAAPPLAMRSRPLTKA